MLSQYIYKTKLLYNLDILNILILLALVNSIKSTFLDGMVSHDLATKTLHCGDAPAVACQYRGQALQTDTEIRIKQK